MSSAAPLDDDIDPEQGKTQLEAKFGDNLVEGVFRCCFMPRVTKLIIQLSERGGGVGLGNGVGVKVNRRLVCDTRKCGS